MYAIISTLDTDSAKIVSDLWQRLCKSCGLKEIYNLSTPHFTWFLAEGLDHGKVMPLIRQIASMRDPFKVHTFGLGIFSGEKPVLYLPIVKFVEMIHLHRAIWNQIQPYGEDPELYYSPRLWVPHITLALKDLTKENLACAVNAIAFDPIELFIAVNNLALVAYENESTGKTLLKCSLKSEQEKF